MNQNEFKGLNNKFLNKLKESLDNKNASCKVLQQDPFTGALHIGIYYKDSPNFLEVYSLSNNGDVAEWSYLGNTQTQ